MRRLLILAVLLQLGACQSKPSADAPLGSIEKHGMVLSWWIDHQEENLEIVLTNTSHEQQWIRAAQVYFEADIIVDGEKQKGYYEKEYFRLLTTSIWLVGPTAFKPGDSVTWSIAFADIEPAAFRGELFSTAINAGELVIEDFWGFRD